MLEGRTFFDIALVDVDEGVVCLVVGTRIQLDGWHRTMAFATAPATADGHRMQSHRLPHTDENERESTDLLK